MTGDHTMMLIFALLAIVPTFFYAMSKPKSGTSTRQNIAQPNATPLASKIHDPTSHPPKKEYTLTNAIGLVASTPQIYKRTNQHGHQFQGTELSLRSLLTTDVFALSYEGLFDIASKGDRVDTILGKKYFDLIDMTTTLPLALVNRSTGKYFEVSENMERIADYEDEGAVELRRDVAEYARITLKATIA